MIDLYTVIAVAWIGWVGSAGIIVSLILCSKKYRRWSTNRIRVITCSLATLTVICILALIFLLGGG